MIITQNFSTRAQKLRFNYTNVKWSPKLSALLQWIISVLNQMLTERNTFSFSFFCIWWRINVHFPSFFGHCQCSVLVPLGAFTVSLCISPSPGVQFLSMTPIWLFSSQNCPGLPELFALPTPQRMQRATSVEFRPPPPTPFPFPSRLKDSWFQASNCNKLWDLAHSQVPLRVRLATVQKMLPGVICLPGSFLPHPASSAPFPSLLGVHL